MAAWIAAGAAGGTFLLEPVLSLIRTGRRDRAYSRLNQILELREKAEKHGIDSPHLVSATDEAIKVVRDRIAVSELGFAMRNGGIYSRLRRTAWQSAAIMICGTGVIALSLYWRRSWYPSWLPELVEGLMAAALLFLVGIVVFIERRFATVAASFVEDEQAVLPWPDFLGSESVWTAPGQAAPPVEGAALPEVPGRA